MGIIKDDEDSLITVSPIENSDVDLTPIKTTSPAINTVTVDNRWTPRANLLTHIEGSIWVIDYFKQVVTANTELSGQQVTLSAPYQQYKLVKELQLKVTDALTSTQNENKTTTVSGEAILIGVFIPNDSDMFIADIGEGQTAVFTVTRTEKLSIYKDAAYKLTYVLLNTDETYIVDLNKKVIETTYYQPNRITTGDTPIVSTEEHNTIIDLTKSYSNLLNSYLNRFYSQEFKTLLVPSQTVSTYDHYLLSLIMSEFDTTDSHLIRDIRILNVQEDQVLKADSIWDAIKYKNNSYLETAFKTAGLVSCKSFSSIPLANGIRFSGINKAVYPLDPQCVVDNLLKHTVKPLSTSVLELPAIVDFTMVDVLGTDLSSLPTFINVNVNGAYVFSESFYSNVPASKFEAMVLKHINDIPIAPAWIMDYVKQHNKLNLVQQFYYTPIILLIMKSILRGI